eukprot:4066112-Amphidinium_carterae.1
MIEHGQLHMILMWHYMKVIGPISYAILFGIIGGVMVHISFRKLLPTALRYDPKNEALALAAQTYPSRT